MNPKPKSPSVENTCNVDSKKHLEYNKVESLPTLSTADYLCITGINLIMEYKKGVHMSVIPLPSSEACVYGSPTSACSRNDSNSLCKFAILWILCMLCPLIHADPLCDLIAATNIQSYSYFNQWSCTNAGVTSTPPCTAPWTGLSCSGSTIDLITVSGALTGIS